MSKDLELYEQNYLSHYGVPGMKWGKRKIGESKARTASIKEARGRQDNRRAELKSLTKERMAAKTQEGKAFLDSKIVDKKFEIKNHDDRKIASQRTAGEKWLKAGTTTLVLGATVFGVGSVVNAIGKEVGKVADSMEESNAEFERDMESALSPNPFD